MEKTRTTRTHLDAFTARLEKIQTQNRRQTIFITGLWFITALVIAAILSPVVSLHFSAIRNFIEIFVCVLVLICWLYYVPFLGVLGLMTYRTRNRNYFNQFFPNLGLMLVVSIVALNGFIEIQENIWTVFYIGFLLVIIVLEIYFLRTVVQGARENKKPLFLWTMFQDSFEAYSSSILSQHSLLIEEELNGYSQRPFFLKISDVTKSFSSKQAFDETLVSYCQFLLAHSELIDYTVESERIILYPRVLLGSSKVGLGLRYIWQLFVKVWHRQGLTRISFDFQKEEMALHIAQADYDLLNEVTYHQLGQMVLNTFKRSFLAFSQGDKTESYSILFPF